MLTVETLKIAMTELTLKQPKISLFAAIGVACLDLLLKGLFHHVEVTEEHFERLRCIWGESGTRPQFRTHDWLSSILSSAEKPFQPFADRIALGDGSYLRDGLANPRATICTSRVIFREIQKMGTVPQHNH